MALGSVGSMVVSVLADTKDFDKKMGTSTKKVDKFQAKVQKMGKAITKAAKLAAAAAAAAVVAFGVSAVKTFVEFDTGMREVFTLMPDLSAEARDAMEEDIQALSEEIGVISTEIIPALYQAISAGVPRENVFEYMRVAGEAAVGGNIELKDSVVGLAQVMNAYGAEVDTVREYSDIMFSIVKDGITTMGELSSELFKVAPVAADLGIQFSSIAGWMAELTAQGVPTAEAASYMKVALNELSKAGTVASDTFEEAAGVTFPKFIAAGGTLVEAFEIIDDYAVDADMSVKDMFGSIEAGGAVLMATGVHFDSFSGKVANAEEASGNTAAAYAEMAAGIEHEIDNLKVWWQNLQLDIGGDITKELKKLLVWLEANQEEIGDGIKKVFKELIAGGEWIVAHSDAVKTGLLIMAGGFAALAAANIIAGIATLTTFIKGLTAFLGPAGVAIIGTAVAVKLLRDELEPIITAAREAGEAAKDMQGSFSDLADSEDRLSKVSAILQSALNMAGGELAQIAGTSGPMSITTLSEIMNALGDLTTVIIESGGSAEKMAAMWSDGVKEILGAYIDSVPGIADALGTIIGQTGKATGEIYALTTTTEDFMLALVGGQDVIDAHNANLAEGVIAIDNWLRELLLGEDVIAEINRSVAEFIAEQQKAAAAVAITTDEIDAAEKSFADLDAELKNTKEGGLDYIVVVGKIQAEYAKLISAAKAVDEQDVETTKRLRELIELYELLGIELDDSVDDAEEWGTEYKNIISSALSDVLSDIVSFHWDKEAAEKDHQQRMLDILNTAADAQLSSEQRKERALADANTAFTRAKEDIDEWYRESVANGDANTHEKRLALDAKFAEKMAEAAKTLARKKEDIETTYSRAVEDLTDDRIQAEEDEIAASKENMPTLVGIVEDGFVAMGTAILNSGIDKAADWAIEQIWNIATESKLASDAANVSLAGIGSAILPVVAVAGAGVVVSDILSGTSTGVSALNEEVNSWFDRMFPNSRFASQNKSVEVPSYGGGGIVPGPMGAPQAAIVHGGEPIGEAGFEEVLDYEKLGQAVTAGFIDAQDEMGGGPRGGSSSDLVTKLAQILYVPLQAEEARRGGAA